MLADPEADDGISHGTGYAMSETVTPVSSWAWPRSSTPR